MYPPLSSKENLCMDFLILTVHLNGFSSMVNAINVVCTITHANSHS
jgi:heme/copper-type cytochrome/quinol oxidase subunit 1